MVERSPEKAGVGGSIPSLATIISTTCVRPQPCSCSILFQKTSRTRRVCLNFGSQWNGISERVMVFRIPTNHTLPNRISTRTVTSTKGHCRTVTVDQLVMLDHWVEEIEEQELATGT